MRVTSFMIYNQILRSLQSGQSDFSTLTERLATDKRILKPSDDVIGAMRAMDYRVQINDNGQYQRNIEGASSNLNITYTALTSVYDTVRKIRDLANTAMSSSQDPGLNAAFAQEAGQLRDHVLSVANTRIGDRYLFSGFRTNIQSYAAGTFAYQGDSGEINVPIAQGAAMPMNVTGDEAFSYTPGAAYVRQISNGQNVHYTPGAGTTVDVEIRDATDTVVQDTFSFSNIMQLSDLLSSSISTNNTARIEALMDPLNKTQDQLAVVQANIGARLSSLKDQSSVFTQATNAVKNSLSATEDADITETAMQLQKTDVTLQALRATSARILSQSLFDFLR